MFLKFKDAFQLRLKGKNIVIVYEVCSYTFEIAFQKINHLQSDDNFTVKHKEAN